MTMTRLKISKTLLAVMLTSAVATGSAYAENNAQTTNESAGQKVDSSMNKVGNFMDDSAITAKVKAALVDHDNIKSTDISVKTDQKVVTLSGFVESQAQAEEAVKVAKGDAGKFSSSYLYNVVDGNGLFTQYVSDRVIWRQPWWDPWRWMAIRIFNFLYSVSCSYWWCCFMVAS